MHGLTNLKIITCAGSGHHLRPDRIEPGAPYFGKSLPVRPLSLPEFIRWCLLSRRLWFVVCFDKLSLSDIPIRNNQAASDWASAVAKVPSKWRGRRKRTEFRSCWRVKCGMSLHPAGNIRLRIPHRPVDLQRCWTLPKKFRQWQRTYWQGLSKIWRAVFNPVWTQMVATSSTCCDVVILFTQRTYFCSNFVAVSLLVLE